MELIGFVLFFFIIGIIVFATAVSAIFIWFGAKIAGISGATFIRSFWAALLTSVLVWALTGIGSALFGIGAIAGWFMGLFVTLFILKSVFHTTWGKAFLAWIFHGLAQLLVLGVVILLVLAGAVVLIL
jgi:hypothetical protein